MTPESDASIEAVLDELSDSIEIDGQTYEIYNGDYVDGKSPDNG